MTGLKETNLFSRSHRKYIESEVTAGSNPASTSFNLICLNVRVTSIEFYREQHPIISPRTSDTCAYVLASWDSFYLNSYKPRSCVSGQETTDVIKHSGGFKLHSIPDFQRSHSDASFVTWTQAAACQWHHTGRNIPHQTYLELSLRKHSPPPQNPANWWCLRLRWWKRFLPSTWTHITIIFTIWN